MAQPQAVATALQRSLGRERGWRPRFDDDYGFGAQGGQGAPQVAPQPAPGGFTNYGAMGTWPSSVPQATVENVYNNPENAARFFNAPEAQRNAFVNWFQQNPGRQFPL